MNESKSQSCDGWKNREMVKIRKAKMIGIYSKLASKIYLDLKKTPKNKLRCKMLHSFIQIHPIVFKYIKLIIFIKIAINLNE